MKIAICMALTLLVLMSCQVPISTQLSTDATVQNTIILATRYANSVELAFETFCVDPSSGRALESANSNALTTYFDNLIIHDASGASVKFSSLSSDQRKLFFLGWKTTTVQAMVQSISSSKEVVTELSDLVDSFDRAFSSRNRSVGGFSVFWDSYVNEYQVMQTARNLDKATARSGGATSGYGTDSIYWEGFYLLRNSYKQGNIIATDTSGASPLGHASMFSESSWRSEWDAPVFGVTNDGWQVDKKARISITSSQSTGNKEYYDVDGNTVPVDLADLFYWGVSYEQLFSWVTHDTWIKHVKVFKPGYRDWSLFGDGTWHEASDADRARAVSNAISNFGKPYNTDWGNRDTTDAFYCSQIVWRAWYDIDTKYNFCPPLLPPGIGIAPNILMMSSNLWSVAEWNMDSGVSYSYYASDVNGDHILDSVRVTNDGVASSGLIEFAINKGDATFGLWTRANSILSNIAPVKFGDFNGDGTTDLLVVNGYGTIAASTVFYSQGNGSFVQGNGPAFFVGGTIDTATADLSRIKVGDFNGDGKADLIVANGIGATAASTVFYSQGSGGFVQGTGPAFFVGGTIDTATVDLNRIKVGDFNGDGKADLIVANGFGSTVASTVFYGQGSGGFVQGTGPAFFVGGTIDTATVDLNRIKVGDFNGDGKADLIVANGFGSTVASTVFYGQGSGSFVQGTGPAFFVGGTVDTAIVDLNRIKVGDFNGDGKADLIVANGFGSTAASTVFYGQGNGSFVQGTGPAFSVGGTVDTAIVDLNRIKGGDFNGDGKTDLIVANGFGSTAASTVFYSQGNGSFIQGTGPTFSIGGTVAAATDDLNRINVGDFSGDGNTDIMLASGWGFTPASAIFWGQGNGIFTQVF